MNCDEEELYLRKALGLALDVTVVEVKGLMPRLRSRGRRDEESKVGDESRDDEEHAGAALEAACRKAVLSLILN